MGSKVRNLTIGTSLCLAVLLIAATAGGQQESNTRAQGVTYNITDLGTLGTGANSVPIWVTESGEVVGYSENGQFDSNGNPIVHAFRWADGVMEDLGTLGGDYSQAYGANEDGQAAGIGDVTGGATSHAVVWDRGAITDLGTLVGPDGFSYAELVNDRHQVIGGSSTADGSLHAVLWDRGMITDLGTLGGKNSFANGINDRRQIVGGSQINDVISPVLGFPPFYPVLWHKGRMLNLGPGPGNMGAAAFNINNRTQVVGRFAAPDPDVGAVAHAFLWQRGAIHDLGVPAGDQDSEALSLNNRGQIVGDSGAGFIETYSADRALLWGRSGPTDLNTLIPADSGYYPIVAFGANDEGEIVVCAVQLSTGNVHAVLLKPDELNMRDRAAMAMTIAPSKVKPQMSGNARRLLEAGRRRKRGEVDRAK